MTTQTLAAPHALTRPSPPTAGIPLTRLVRVELRKLVDTRAGRWLLVAIGLVTLASIAIVALATPTADRTFSTFMAATAPPQGFLLPVMSILLVTSEWTQRTALVTFSLEPRRGRVLLAKVLASSIAGVAAIGVGVGLAAAAAALLGADTAFAGVGIATFVNFAVLQLSSVLQGLAFGLLFLATTPAVVTYFVLPTAFTLVTTLWSAMEWIQPWVDLGHVQLALFEVDPLTGTEWLHLAVTSGLWIVLPLALGAVRLLRAEVK